MTYGEETRTPKWGPLTIAVIIFASVALSVILFGKLFRSGDHTAGASAVRTQSTERRPAGKSSSPPPAEPRQADRTRNSQQGVTGASRPDDENDAAQKVGLVDSRKETEAWSPETAAALQARAQDRESDGVPRASGGAGLTVGATPAVPEEKSSEVSHLAHPDTRVGDSGIPSYGLPASASGSPREVSAPAEEKQPIEVEPDSDRTPPVVESLHFDPPVVMDGNETTLTIQASDDLSGVKSIWGNVRSPNGAGFLSFGPQDAGNSQDTSNGQGARVSDVFAFKLSVPSKAESGMWYVSHITLTDRAGNFMARDFSAPMALPGGTLQINSSESDSTAPEVVQIWFEKPVIGDGERNTIKIDARDDRSGVAFITGSCQSPSKSALVWFHCALNAESGFWEGDVTIPVNADCGEWAVQQMRIADKAGNIAYLTSDASVLVRAGFQVTGSRDCDSDPPTLDAFDLSPTIVSNETATEILVTATVHDVGTGAVAMTGWFEGPVSTNGQVPRNYFSCAPNPRDPESPWTGKILVPKFSAKGTWKVGLIRLQDKAVNFRQYTSEDPAVAGRVFEVE